MYKYAKIHCKDSYTNANFDNILDIIGKYYFHRDDLGINGVCALIKDEINKEWHLNGLRKSIQL